MKIANIMFARGRGGVEQAFVDYCEALRSRGHEVTGFAHPEAWALKQAEALGVPVIGIPNFAMFDVIAIWRLRQHLRALKPDAVIIHGKRALTLTRHALNRRTPLIAVVHNYWQPYKRRLAAVFCVSNDLAEHMAGKGVPSNRLFVIPNLVHCERITPQCAPWRSPPVIGTMGRMVEKKGFDVFLRALKLLDEESMRFSAVLAGEGTELGQLRALARELGLEDRVTFPGWVEDRTSFFRGIDLFCLPSLHEPFGIVLLEAMAHGVPVVATDSEGPREIIGGHDIAVLSGKGDAAALAEGLKRALANAEKSRSMALNARAYVEQYYALAPVARKLDEALKSIP